MAKRDDSFDGSRDTKQMIVLGLVAMLVFTFVLPFQCFPSRRSPVTQRRTDSARSSDGQPETDGALPHFDWNEMGRPSRIQLCEILVSAMARKQRENERPLGIQERQRLARRLEKCISEAGGAEGREQLLSRAAMCWRRLSPAENEKEFQVER